MKFQKPIYFLLCLLSIVSCGEDELNPGVESGQLTADVEGQQFTSTEAAAVINDNFISIAAKNSNGDAIALLIKGTTTGTYEVLNNVTTLTNTIAFTPSEDTTFTSSYNIASLGGTIVITEINLQDSLISGNFNAVLGRYKKSLNDTTINITAGSFNKIVLGKDVEPVIFDNSFSGKVNGVSFEPITITGLETSGKLILGFTKGGSESITITVPSNVTPGNYNLGGMGSTYSGNYVFGSGSLYDVDNGNLQITSHNETANVIEGTFSFSGSDYFSDNTVNVTEAQFSVQYFD